MKDGLGFITTVLHTPFLKKDPQGALRYPVYQNAAFEADTAEDLESFFQGKKYGHVYSRITNPTVEHLENQIRTLTQAQGVIAYSSGMAAISSFFLSVLKQGDEVLTTRHLFGNTLSFLKKTLEPFGVTTRFADMTDPADVEKNIRENTRVIFLETVTNPQIEVADIRRISELAKKSGVILAADTTVTPFYLFDAKAHGVDIEILSSTKFISGGGTSIGGILIDHGSYPWNKNPQLKELYQKNGPFALLSRLRREITRNLGACLSPESAWMQSLGLETLPLRADRACENTLKIANLLKSHPQSGSVNYPALEDSPFYEISKRQFNGRPGALLSFNLKSREACFKLMNSLKLARRATNLNDNKTLILHPASTIFHDYSPAERESMNIPDTLIRLAVGIEDFDDLRNDFLQALEGL
jgi:O-acetylhomoserine (thiol)-lyase